MKRKEVQLEIIAFLFVLLFLYAAGSKLLEYEKFKMQLSMSPMIAQFAPFFAWIVPISEIAISVMLIIPHLRPAGFYAAFGLMMAFTFYIMAILTISKELPCSCGGVLSGMEWKDHLIFNICFDALGIAGIIFINDKKIGPSK